jgi:flagellar basal body-associated protein FliL
VKRFSSTLGLGTFTVELKEVPGHAGAWAVMNLAEVEIFIECDGSETRSYLDEHLTLARDQVTGVFTALNREDLMTREGKAKLRRLIIKKLNEILPQGKVEELYFSKLLVS